MDGTLIHCIAIALHLLRYIFDCTMPVPFAGDDACRCYITVAAPLLLLRTVSLQDCYHAFVPLHPLRFAFAYGPAFACLPPATLFIAICSMIYVADAMYVTFCVYLPYDYIVLFTITVCLLRLHWLPPNLPAFLTAIATAADYFCLRSVAHFSGLLVPFCLRYRRLPVSLPVCSITDRSFT